MSQDHELEAALRRVLTTNPEELAAQRILSRLDTLPPQRRVFAWWPSILMDWNFAPAWPRLAALACAAVLGISIGFSGFGTRIVDDWRRASSFNSLSRMLLQTLMQLSQM